MVTEPTKACRNCGRILPLSNFYARSASVDGHQSWCKMCSRARRLEWANENREHLRELHRQTYRRRCLDPDRAGSERARKRDWYRRVRGTRPEDQRSSAFTQSVDSGSEPLHAGSFALWLLSVEERDGASRLATAERLGIPDRMYRRIVNGEQLMVELATVERALIADDSVSLRDVYPDLYSEAA